MIRSVLLLACMAAFASATEPVGVQQAEDAYIAEAPLADGWPMPGEPDAISLVDLPAHRAAEGPGFWSLFLHISVGKLPMTAPVVMPTDGARARSMRFVYPRADTGPAPTAQGIRIVDVAPQRVLRITRRGSAAKDDLGPLAERLRTAATERGLRATGEPWLCGYNSPGVPRDRQTWELMLPVETMDPPAAQP